MLASNLPEEFSFHANNCTALSEIIECCPVDGTKKRHGKIESQDGTTYLLSTEDKHLKSSRLFKELLLVHHEFSPSYQTIADEAVRISTKVSQRVLHNLRSINAHMIQELYSLIPQDALTRRPLEQIDTIKEFILKDPEESARAFLRLAKLNAAAKIEFSVTRKIYEKNPKLQIRSHNIVKVLLNVFHYFFDDLKDLGVYVDIPEYDKYVRLDYEAFHVCLYHIIENSIKYILPGTRLKIRFDEEPSYFIIKLDMISMLISSDEKDRIFEEGYSGRSAKKAGKAGQGIGMFRAHKAIGLNQGTLNIHTGVGTYRRRKRGRVYYENNVFEIRLLDT